MTQAKDITDNAVQHPKCSNFNNKWVKNKFRNFKKGDTALKTIEGQGHLLLWKIRANLKLLNNSQMQALMHCRQNLVFHKAPSINNGHVNRC